MPRKKWTNEEIQILTDAYLSTEKLDKNKLVEELSGRPWEKIRVKAGLLGLAQQRRKLLSDALIGKRFGRWTILSDLGVVNGHRMVYCECDCGTKKNVDLNNLRLGLTKSCGCYHDEVSVQNGMNNKKENEYDLASESYGVGWTYDDYAFFFDKEDYELIKPYCWHKHQDGYLRTRYDWYTDESGKIHNKYIMLHQLISNKYFNGNQLDHINGQPNDNRKSNLRPATQADNMKNVKLPKTNTSGHKGVSVTPSNTWIAHITCNGKRIYLGTYSTYEEAVKVREKAENRLFKDFNREKEYL